MVSSTGVDASSLGRAFGGGSLATKWTSNVSRFANRTTLPNGSSSGRRVSFSKPEAFGPGV